MYVLVKALLQPESYEDVVERLIRHEVKPSAILGLETTSEFSSILSKTVP